MGFLLAKEVDLFAVKLKSSEVGTPLQFVNNDKDHIENGDTDFLFIVSLYHCIKKKKDWLVGCQKNGCSLEYNCFHFIHLGLFLINKNIIDI